MDDKPIDHNINDRLTQAITLIKAGNKADGGALLASLVRENPKNETAWLWLSACVATNEQKIYCLKKVIEINPDNDVARKALTELTSDQPKIEPQMPVQEPATFEDLEPTPSASNVTTSDATGKTGMRLDKKNKKTSTRGLAIYLMIGAACLLLTVIAAGVGVIGLGLLDNTVGLAFMSTATYPPSPTYTPSITAPPSFTPTPTFTATPTITKTPTFTPTPVPTITPMPSPTLEIGTFQNPASIGVMLTRTSDPSKQVTMNATLLEFVRDAEAEKLAQSLSACGMFPCEPLSADEEFLGVKVRLEVIDGDINKKYTIYPYWSLTLRYDEAGKDTWSVYPFQDWGAGYIPVAGEGWVFYKIRKGSQPLLYFHPHLIVTEQIGIRTEGGYYSLTNP
jgi:hypothetical protein